MEDNEFEEVTIISHTDRPQRVFSEKSIEKLKDQVSLEIVKEINGTEDKTYNDDPRLAPGLRELEKLKQDHFSEVEVTPDRFNFISRVAGESGQYLLGASMCAILANGHKTDLITDFKEYLFIQPWGPYLFLFCESLFDDGFVDVLSISDFSTVKKLTQMPHIKSSRHVQTTEQFLYFKSDDSKALTRVDRILSEQNVVTHLRQIQDFFVCPKTETITTLHHMNKDYAIQRDEFLRYFTGSVPHSVFNILKKMYSDHFLVGEINDNNQETSIAIHLVDSDLFGTLSRVDFTIIKNTLDQNIRLLAPRQGISCFLVLTNPSLELFCEYRLKLYHLKTLEIKVESRRGLALSHICGDLWTIGSQKALTAVRVRCL